MKVHHRNYPFRPPRRQHGAADDAGFGLCLRFMRTYLGPHKWLLFFCMLLVGMNACSVYLISFYGRIVVDRILVVSPIGAPEQDGAAPPRRRIAARDRSRPQRPLPRAGVGRRIDRAAELSRRPPGARQRLWLLFALYVMTQVTLNLAARLAQRARIRIGQRVTGALREDMHRKVMELSISYHAAHNPGRLMARILSDVGIVQQRMIMLLTRFSRSAAMVLVGVCILVLVDVRMALIALVVVPLYALIYRQVRPKVREVMREQRHTNSCLFGLTSQKFDAMKAIQAYGRERHERLNFHRLVACFFRDALLQQRLSATLSCSTGIISGVGATTVFLLGAWAKLHDQMSLGEMMFVYSATLNLFQPVLDLVGLGVTYNTLLVVLQRITGVLDQNVEIADAPDAVPFPRPVRQGISLRGVRFAYGSDPENEPVLRDISLDVPAGTWLCVMGASGCGKTTLLYLLARLHEPTAGQILVDDIPLARLQMDSLRRAVGFVPQEAQIFSGTVRENICYGRPHATPEQIMAAAKAAEMHDFILDMPIQYESRLDQKGSSLSGGQRQRLSLARALLTDPEILILDDCTSALDADTEQRIQNTLDRILLGKTAVIVSQRVSMAKRCHRICTLENGMVTELGTHEQLVAGTGFYARLHAQQTE